MITPEDKIPFDDSSNEEADDQQSQKDVHGNGFDETVTNVEENTPTDILDQAYDAAEPSYTLNTDQDTAKTEDED